jgi:putative cardiolipin synthase
VTASPGLAQTTLASAVVRLTREHPGLSGIVPLREGYDAFAARVLLADHAEQTLDVQYYIWHDDISGTLLLDALRRAADRGVRVRLLLDDNNTTELDEILAALDAHPSVEVRLFNPFHRRRARWLDYLTDFARLNRRMHNKSFTADDHVTIVGGRNVGDEYFGAGHDVLFVDLDVLAIGPVVSDVSSDFDRYWHSQSAWPAHRVIPPASAASIAGVTAAAALKVSSPDAATFVNAVERAPFVRDLVEGRLSFDWAPTLMLSDDPAKGLGHAPKDSLLWPRLRALMGAAASELHLISAYLVPGATGSDELAALAKRGVKVSVLTNSLEATDVAAVHAGYAKYRKPMLERGVTLFEMKRASSSPRSRRALVGGSGSSRSSLHAKTFAIDRARIYVGSFNFDPRSARLNTELGFLIDSPALARQLAETFTEGIPERSYRVRLDEGARLEWTESRDGRDVVYDREPGTGVGLRLAVAALAVLPIEWLL